VVGRLGNDAVRQVRNEFGAARVQKLEVEVADALEQPLAAFASGSSNIHRWRRSPPSPMGSARLWFGPATNPSIDIAMSHVTLVMLPPLSQLYPLGANLDFERFGSYLLAVAEF
jgi:hypothetical protein